MTRESLNTIKTLVRSPLCAGLIVVLWSAALITEALAEKTKTPEAKPNTASAECTVSKGTCRIVSKKIRKVTKPVGWKIDIAYPQFSGEPADKVQVLNQSVAKLVNGEKMKVNIRGPKIDPPEIPYWFNCTYESLLETPHLVSIVFHYNKFCGGAHGDSWSVPFNFQVLPVAKKLSLNDLFGKPVDLNILSNLCRLELYKKLNNSDSMSVMSGTDPKDAKNLSLFCFDKTGVVFYFEPYQVAPYSEGPQELRLSYGKLRKIFAPGSPVYKFVQESKDQALELDGAKLAAEAAAAAKNFDKRMGNSSQP